MEFLFIIFLGWITQFLELFVVMIDNLFQYFVIFILFIIIYPIYKIYKSNTETSSSNIKNQINEPLKKYNTYNTNNIIYINVESKNDIHTFCPKCKKKIKLSNHFRGGWVCCLICTIKFYTDC